MGAIAALAAVVALAGGGVAAVGVHALDDTSKTVTTTVEAASTSSGDSGATSSSSGSSAAAAFARSGGKSVSSIYKQDAPGVVTITSTITSSTSGDFSPFGPGQSQRETAQGSGFVIDKDGRILTNAHVVAGASSVVVAFEDGVSAKATVLGRDSLYDLAVIKVDVPQSELHPLTLGTVSSVQVGDPVVAIGNPFGYAQTVTAGIVSAKGRLISSPAGNDKFIPGAIQTDAAINHGNSGGPLIDRHGDVIAINAQIADPQITGTDANAGVGFAIPIDLAKRALANLEAGKPASHPYLGIRVDALNASVSAASSKLPSSGLLIAGVAKDSPAAAAGLKGGSQSLDVGGQQYCVGGDVITSIDGHAVATLDDLQERLSSFAAGDKLQLGITGGDGSRRTVTVTVGSIPAQRQPLATGC
ncbi:MAG: trypsin-like peptidase domain-containing protein [Actinomycetota bacterium]|nr:trypsin-like peptidase domain-containing protein [Actinomycetota bacterium]